MSSKDSVGKVTEAISELEQATVPVVHQVIGMLQKNVEQLSVAGKEALHIMDSNVDRIAGAASRLASSGAELVATVLGSRNISPKPPASAKRP